MSAVTVTYGRNIGTEPMPGQRWRSFHRAVLDVLAAADASIYADAAYRGHWDGHWEDARIARADVPDDLVPAVRTALGELARAYGQEAIGLAVGTSELVEPREERGET